MCRYTIHIQICTWQVCVEERIEQESAKHHTVIKVVGRLVLHARSAFHIFFFYLLYFLFRSTFTLIQLASTFYIIYRHFCRDDIDLKPRTKTAYKRSLLFIHIQSTRNRYCITETQRLLNVVVFVLLYVEKSIPKGALQ